ncbi:hypothetical protein FACS1894164_01840 [Spirochaetia bacterium]|nr:hypothetical protein FACS1894164_01840 [Spirochaetia bacterium]
MDATANVSGVGKKIFFLYPSGIIQAEVVDKLAQQEFEVYVVRNHQRFISVLRQFPESIVFADIDEQLSDNQWETLIRNILAEPFGDKLDIGVLSTSNNPDLRQKYLNTLKVSCGFVIIHSDLRRTSIQIMDILKAADAKGKRRYLRANMGADNESMTSLNIPFNGRFIKGTIKDISIVGFSCVFDTDPSLERDDHIPDIQIKLHGILIKADAIVFGSRIDDETAEKIYVLLFSPRTSSSELIKIHKYIQTNLQTAMDKLLK